MVDNVSGKRTMTSLTARQRQELNESILEYLSLSDLKRTYEVMKQEMGIQIDAEPKYNGLLEKKWTSVVRLQKKVMDLEAKVGSLQEELDNVPSSGRTIADPSKWLPRSPRYELTGHRQSVTGVAFHPVFTQLASGSEDQTVKIWDWEVGELERTLKGHTKSVTDVDYGGHGTAVMLASSSADLTIKLWDASNEYENVRTLKGHDHTVSSVRFVGDGTYVVSASQDTTVRVWQVKTGYCVRVISTAHVAGVKAVAPVAVAGGPLLVSVGADMAVVVTDVTTGHTRLRIPDAHDHVIECVAVAPRASNEYFGLAATTTTTGGDDFFFATGGRDRRIKVWNSRGRLVMTLDGHENWVRAVEFHPAGRFVVSAGDDKTIRCWDLTKSGPTTSNNGDGDGEAHAGVLARTIERAHGQFVTSLRWAPSSSKRGIRCAVATAGEDVRVWT
ncbi:WD40-repeat-containing domain protein [Lipomyces japonicus]|uniref:WD40-repeat-containing domain protein n=1 Tax=Lipomyces japonicus TaxID=56871 RepID=UPI0034CE14EC